MGTLSTSGVCKDICKPSANGGLRQLGHTGLSAVGEPLDVPGNQRPEPAVAAAASHPAKLLPVAAEPDAAASCQAMCRFPKPLRRGEDNPSVNAPASTDVV